MKAFFFWQQTLEMFIEKKAQFLRLFIVIYSNSFLDYSYML